MSGDKFKIGQLVNHLGRVRASGDYQVTQLFPALMGLPSDGDLRGKAAPDFKVTLKG